MNNLPNFMNDFIKCDYLFLAGDIGYPDLNENGLFYQFISWCTDNYKKVFYVMGNHESYNTDMNNVRQILYDISKIKQNFIFLEKGVISHLEEYKVIGCTLWSHLDKEAFQYMNDKNFIKINDKKINREDIIKIHKEDKIWIKNNIDKNTIVMTHHLPSFNLIHPEYQNVKFERRNTAYASDCDDLIKKAKTWIYGHTHKASDKLLYDVRCICNPHGYYNDDDKNSGFSNNVFEIII
jgi:predicted phosphohydrolase